MSTCSSLIQGDKLTLLLCRSASGFKKVTDQTRSTYRLSILATVCLLVRVKFLISSKKAPKGLRLYVSQSQIQARDRLFNLYLETTDTSKLLPDLHQLLVSILCHSTSNRKLACPTDYSMCLTCLGDKVKIRSVWSFKKPSEITNKFAALQYCFRMVFFIHCYTLCINKGSYQHLLPIPSMVNSTHQPDLFLPGPPTDATEPTFSQSDLLLELQEVEEYESTVEVITPEDSQLLGEEEEVEVTDEGDDQELLG